MESGSKILVTGAGGMVGSAVVRILKHAGFNNILTPSRYELNLDWWLSVNAFFAKHRPEYVFMIAAKVGGIGANVADPVGFLDQNLRIASNLFENCHHFKVKKCLFLGSSCIYPRDCPQPMKEEYLLTGPLEPTNEGYALSKIVGLKLAEYYKRQHGMDTVCPMPCNIYGTNDHFDLQKSHVLSALVKRFVDAKDEGKDSITLWGSGVARREFIHTDDVARAILFLMQLHEPPQLVNVGTGYDVSIFDLALLVAKQVNFDGTIHWDTSKPDGMPRKCLDVSKLIGLGYQPLVSLEQGIRRTIDEYREIKTK